MIITEAGSEEWKPNPLQRSHGVVQSDVLGTTPFTIDQRDLELTTTADSLVIDTGFGYTLKRIEIPFEALDAAQMRPETLQVYTALYNSEIAYERQEEAHISISHNTVTITFPAPVFTRYVKLHSTVHTLADDGDERNTGTIFQADASEIIVTAITGGRNEFYNYTPDGNRSMRSILAGSMQSEQYQYYPNSDLLQYDGTYYYAYDA